VILGSWALVLVPVGLILLLRRRVHKLSRLDSLYLRFCAKLERSGVVREPGESPTDFALRAQHALPRLADRIADVTRRYQHLAYAGSQKSEHELKEFARAVRNLNR
jgi:hypothetical protein